MAETLLRELSAGAIEAASAGSEGAGEIDPMAAAAMDEIGIPITGSPKKLTPQMVQQADVIITMGCGVNAENCPANWFQTEDWGIDDPRGKDIEAYRGARDAILARIRGFLQATPESGR